jgi:hypothetical protein
MSGLLRFSKAPEGPASPLWYMARTPFALMQQCRRTAPTHWGKTRPMSRVIQSVSRRVPAVTAQSTTAITRSGSVCETVADDRAMGGAAVVLPEFALLALGDCLSGGCGGPRSFGWSDDSSARAGSTS